MNVKRFRGLIMANSKAPCVVELMRLRTVQQEDRLLEEHADAIRSCAEQVSYPLDAL